MIVVNHCELQAFFLFQSKPNTGNKSRAQLADKACKTPKTEDNINI